MIKVYRYSRLLMAIAIAAVPLSSCSNGFGQSLQRSLSADPQLAENADQIGSIALADLEACPPELIDQVSANVPSVLCYPEGDLLETRLLETGNNGVNNTTGDTGNEASTAATPLEMTWQTSDSRVQVLQFYQSQLEEDGWEITNPSELEANLRRLESSSSNSNLDGNGSESPNGATADEQPRDRSRDTGNTTAQDLRLEAVKSGDRTLILMADKRSAIDAEAEASQTSPTRPSESSPESDVDSDPITEFVIEWRPDAARQAATTDRMTSSPPWDRSRPNDRQNSGFSTSSSSTSDGNGENRSASSIAQTQPAASSEFADLDDVPADLEPYVRDLAELGVLTPATTEGEDSASSDQFKPNATISRRTYARWLFRANNTLYGDRPARKIRAATNAAQPVFSDVPQTDPDFAAIQGLAEAGLIPSPLSGASTAVSFRPNAALTREALLNWKVPLDVRGTLPSATVSAIQETWGFQDANRIDPNALKAVLADYQNGDNANILRAFGYTTLLQPQKSVTRAEAAAVLWYFGYQGDGISAGAVLESQPEDSE